MSEDMMDYSGDRELDMSEDTYTVRCDYCERDVVHSVDTGEPVASEGGCSDMSCPLLSSTREGGDPEPLDFNEGC